MYIVNSVDYDVFAYTDIKKAYDKVQYIIIKRGHVGYKLNSTVVKVILIYKGQVALEDSSLLFDNFYNDIDILQYPNLPGLKLKNMNLLYYHGTRSRLGIAPNNISDPPNDKFVGVFDYSSTVLASFMTYIPYEVDYPHEYINSYQLLTINSDTAGQLLWNFKYGYRGRVSRHDGTGNRSVTYLVNESLFGKPLYFREFVYRFPEYRLELLPVLEQQTEQYYTNK